MDAQFKLWSGAHCTYSSLFGDPPHWVGELEWEQATVLLQAVGNVNYLDRSTTTILAG
jgi:hypothetical protein